MEFGQNHHLEPFQLSGLQTGIGRGKNKTCRCPYLPITRPCCFPRTTAPRIPESYLVLGQVLSLKNYNFQSPRKFPGLWTGGAYRLVQGVTPLLLFQLCSLLSKARAQFNPTTTTTKAPLPPSCSLSAQQAQPLELNVTHLERSHVQLNDLKVGFWFVLLVLLVLILNYISNHFLQLYSEKNRKENVRGKIKIKKVEKQEKGKIKQNKFARRHLRGFPFLWVCEALEVAWFSRQIALQLI